MTYFFFFFNDTATTEIYTLSLHDALPICTGRAVLSAHSVEALMCSLNSVARLKEHISRSEEHTSELQSQSNLVCRLLLEKKKNNKHTRMYFTVIHIICKCITYPITKITKS